MIEFTLPLLDSYRSELVTVEMVGREGPTHGAVQSWSKHAQVLEVLTTADTLLI